MDNTTNTIGETFSMNVYGDDDSQVWVATLNKIGVDMMKKTDFLLIGRCHVVLTESQDSSEITESPNIYELPSINAIGALTDGVTIVRVLEHLEDVMPFE